MSGGTRWWATRSITELEPQNLSPIIPSVQRGGHQEKRVGACSQLHKKKARGLPKETVASKTENSMLNGFQPRSRTVIEGIKKKKGTKLHKGDSRAPPGRALKKREGKGRAGGKRRGKTQRPKKYGWASREKKKKVDTILGVRKHRGKDWMAEKLGCEENLLDTVLFRTGAKSSKNELEPISNAPTGIGATGRGEAIINLNLKSFPNRNAPLKESGIGKKKIVWKKTSV